MYYIQNQTGGGTVTVTGCKAPDIQKDTLIVNSFNINGYGGGDYATFYSNQITGNVNLSDAASYTGGYNSSSRYNTIYGNTQITINGTNQYYESNVANSGNTYYGNVTYIRNGGQINIESSDSTSIAGDLTIQSSTPLNLAKIRFFSNTPSVIDQLGSALITIENLIVDKTGAGKLTLAEPVSIITNTAFVNGYVYTNSLNPLIFRDNATHLTASDNSHVVGQVMKIGNDIFTFPLGNGIGLNTIGISAPSNTTDSVAATIILNDANLDGYNRASKDPTILQLVPYHYWTLNRISGSNALSIKLGWGNPCVNAGITNLPTLTVARWDGSLWDDLGNSATSGSAASGTVTMTGTTTSYGPFLLGTTSNLNQWQVTSVTASASTVCQGVSTTLSGSGANTYTWMPGSLSGTSVIVTPLSTTTYTVTGTSATGCITTATKTITVNPLPTTSTSISSNPICAGNATTITASGANAGYVWQPGGMTTTAITVSPASSTTYTVTGTNTFGCTLSATRTVTVNPLPSVGTTVTNATICAGTSTSITGTGANTYTWMPGSLSGTTVNVSPASTTTYTVTGTNTATGCTNTATRTITVNSLPTVGTTVTNATICSGTSTSMTGTGANTYTWMPGSLSGTTVNVSPASTTTYTVTGTNTATGCTNTATRTITVNSLPTVGTTVTNATICAGTSTSITGTGANTYTWMPGSLSGTTVSVSPASTTTYTVTGTNTATGCTNTATRTITVTPCNSVLNLKLYLQGYYIGSGFMTPVLQNQGVSSNPLLVDSINVELRNTTAPYAMVSNAKTILNTNGTATCTFGPVNGNYYVVVKHRNT
ncbi:MAG TPA: hypothetical protein PLP34_05745, partial [Chitinophagaceae bacterium]|nr:hypothetical protein [Chitinophagaceae bacterium]